MAEQPAPESIPSDQNNTPTEPPASSGPSPAIILFVLLPLVGLGIALGVLLADQNAQNGDSTGDGITLAPVGQTMPSLDYPASDFTVDTLDGDTITLSDFRGRVVFLNFWGTWCPPCVRELPALEQFATEQGEAGAVVLASNDTETEEIINQFLTDEGITLNNVRILLDADSNVFRRYVIPAMPTTYIIDQTGMVRKVQYGELTLEVIYSLLEEVEGLQTDEAPTAG